MNLSISVRVLLEGNLEEFASRWKGADVAKLEAPVSLEWPSKKLASFCATLKSSECSATVEVASLNFENAALSRFDWFDLRARQVHISDADADWRFEEWKRVSYENPDDPSPIKIFRQMVVSRVKGAAEEVRFVAGQFDLFVPHVLSTEASAAGLTGFVPHSLVNHRGKVDKSVDFWEISSLLPSCAASALSDHFIDDEGRQCFYANRLFAYRERDMRDFKFDFNRARESCGGFHTGRIVISRRAMEFLSNRARGGLSFMPVLPIESSDYREMEVQWERFVDDLGGRECVRMR